MVPPRRIRSSMASPRAVMVGSCRNAVDEDRPRLPGEVLDMLDAGAVQGMGHGGVRHAQAGAAAVGVDEFDGHLGLAVVAGAELGTGDDRPGDAHDSGGGLRYTMSVGRISPGPPTGNVRSTRWRFHERSSSAPLAS